MKTTIDIADDLLSKSKKLARENHTTLREIVEEGLALVLKEKAARKPFRLKLVTFKGTGMAPEFKQGGWPAIRDEIYRGHGS